MNTQQAKQERFQRRKQRVRAKVKGTAERPRLSVYRSVRYIYASLIDDVQGVTIASATDRTMKSGTKIERATEVGKQIAAAAKDKNVSSVVFDRGGRLFHGRVKAVAEAAREGGLQF